MATKIRLQRFGRKKKAYYHIVVADARAPRDGRYVERIGDYNPNTNPASINLDFDKAVKWYGTGAEPTETVKAILAYKGILMRHHLNRGVAKGAMTQEVADEKFAAWMSGKDSQVDAKKDKLANAKADARKTAMEAEEKRKKATAAKVAAKYTVAEEIVEEVAVVVEETPVIADAVEEVVATTEEVVVEEVKAEVTETPAETEAPATEEPTA